MCRDLDMRDEGREVVDLAILTQRAGRRAFIASSGGALVTDSERAAVRHFRIPLHTRGMVADWRSRLRLSALIQKERPALVHAHGGAFAEMASSLCRTYRTPLVLDIHQPLADVSWIKRVVRNVGDLPWLVRVPSRFMENYVQDVCGVAKQKIRYVPSGIDLQWFRADAISPERLHKLSRLWRLPEQGTVVLMPTPLEQGAGIENLLQAMVTLRQVNLFAVIVGSDRYAPGLRAMFEQKIVALGLDGKVIMPEFCDDWPTAFWLSGVVVAPNTVPRGQHRALLGAQAMGRPVIVSDIGANREMLEAGATGWVMKPGDDSAFTTALLQAAELSMDQRLGLTESTREFISAHFPQNRWLGGMTAIYDDLMGDITAGLRVA